MEGGGCGDEVERVVVQICFLEGCRYDVKRSTRVVGREIVGQRGIRLDCDYVGVSGEEMSRRQSGTWADLENASALLQAAPLDEDLVDPLWIVRSSGVVLRGVRSVYLPRFWGQTPMRLRHSDQRHQLVDSTLASQ